MRIRELLALAVVSLSARPVRAQDVRIADSLLRAGLLDRAETEYYAAARARPRDPGARLALGKYLLNRGAFRIGATLIDEAMQFGYDRTTGSALLARVYMNLGEHVAAERYAAVLSADERALVRWLADRAPRADSLGSAVLVAYTRPATSGYLGTLRLRLNGRPVVAMVSPRSDCGLRLSDTTAVASTLHRFTSGATASGISYRAADSLALGRLTLRNVGVEVARISESSQAVLCLGMVARFAPTFDPRANLITLHGGGVAPPPSRASVVAPILDVDGVYSVLRGTMWSALGSRDVATLLGDRRWTFDPRRRQVAIEP